MWSVVIPDWQHFYKISNKALPKYWEWKDRDKLPDKHTEILKQEPICVGSKLYCQDVSGNRFIKNTKSVGNPKIWVLNGQDLYNARLNWRLRKVVARFYHDYFGDYIKDQLTAINIPSGKHLSISCDIYEIKRGNIPDVSNMWLLEKFFEDALQEYGIIPDDNPDYVLESGRKRYIWVDKQEDRKLIFKIELI